MTESNLPNVGELRTRQRRRKKIIYYVFSGVLGGLIGFSLAASESGDGNFMWGDISGLSLDPALALAFAVLFLGALLVLPLWGYTQIDEVALKQNLIGMSAGCMAVIAGYPTWAVLSMGDWLPEPTAFGVFLIGLVAMAFFHLVAKIRG